MQPGDDHESQVCGKHGEIPVSEVHYPHYPEHQGQAAREKRVEAAEENSLDYRVDPDQDDL